MGPSEAELVRSFPVLRIGKRILVSSVALNQMLVTRQGAGGVRKMKPRKAGAK